MNVHFRLLFIFVVATATAHGRDPAAMELFQRRILFINGESLNNQHPSQCIGLIFDKNILRTASNCMKENAFSENTPVMDVKNSIIGYLSLTDQHENDSYFKENHSVFSESEDFYIYTGNPKKTWLPVQVSKPNDEVFTFSPQAEEKQPIKMGAPVINDKGEIVCLNNGNGFCEPPSMSTAVSISAPNKNCPISTIPFPCTNVAWHICNTVAQVGIGQCHREYDQALCDITLNGHASGISGTISCHGCDADWLEKSGEILEQSETPSGCMSNHFSEWKTGLYVVVGATSFLIIAVFITVLGVKYKKSRALKGYERI